MSGVGTGIALAAGLGVAGAGIGAAASTSAASTQASAAEQGQQLQAQEAQNALNFQEQEFNTQQTNQAPFLKAGQGAVTDLSQLLGPGGALTQPWTQQFTPPTIQQAEEYPGYQFQEQQGEQAVANQATAAGEALDPNAARAEANYAEQSAQSDYGNVYNQALQQYQQSYNIFQQNQANQYNRLAGLAGTGQVSAGQLGQTGQSAATNVGNIMLGTANSQAQEMNNAAAATASGYVGAGNAVSGALNGVGSTLALQQLLGGTPGTTPINYGENPSGTYDPSTGVYQAV